MLIGQSDESGSQLHDNILGKQAEYNQERNLDEVLNDFKPTDVVFFPGRYDNTRILDSLLKYTGKIYIDMNYDSKEIIDLGALKIQTVFISTSSITFKEYFNRDSYRDIINLFKEKDVEQLLIKENRGGSFLYDYVNDNCCEAPAYLGGAIHSVGVGDVYDIAFLLSAGLDNISHRMSFASWISAAYARTMMHESFKRDARLIKQHLNEFVEMDGIRVPWNERRNYSIYIAAPDFDYVDTKIIDILEKSLQYHNFRTRRPIKENGQMADDTSIDEEISIFTKDVNLLAECKIMIAVLLYNDQGTLVEIGNYQASNKPIILYDPYMKVDNLFLKNACIHYCNTNSQVVDAVFIEFSRMVNNEKKV